MSLAAAPIDADRHPTVAKDRQRNRAGSSRSRTRGAPWPLLQGLWPASLGRVGKIEIGRMWVALGRLLYDQVNSDGDTQLAPQEIAVSFRLKALLALEFSRSCDGSFLEDTVSCSGCLEITLVRKFAHVGAQMS
jgi:hypothetical protein